MHDNPLTVLGDDLMDLPGLATALKHQRNEVDRALWALLGDDTRRAIEAFPGDELDHQLRGLLVRDLNKIIDGPSIYSAECFPNAGLRLQTKRLVKLDTGESIFRKLRNRLLLEDAYPLMLRRFEDKPFTIEELKARVETAWTKAFSKLATIGNEILTRKTFTRNWPLKPQDFEEIINDAVIDTYTNIDQCKGLGGVKTYFLKATLSCAIDRLRQEQARKRGDGQVTVTPDLSDLETPEDEGRMPLLDEVDPNVLDWTSLDQMLPSVGPQAIYEAHIVDMRHVIVDARKQLDESDQVLLTDYYENQLTQDAIAKKLNKSTNQIGIKVERAREKLARKMPASFTQEMRELYGR
jgi:RNA polymerase sigma factor (sigma-70 family)